MSFPKFFRIRSARLGALILSLSGLLIAGRALAAEPTKADAVTVLRGLFSALEAKDYAKAAAFLQNPPGLSPEVLQKEVAKFIERNEISAAGITVLDAKGKWGKLSEAVEPARAQRFADKFGVALEACYGLALGNAEAGFFWDGKQLRIIRCDDIGKLGDK